MAKFNVLHEPWLYAMDKDGTPVQLSVLETFERAHELQTVTESNPLATYGVFRFLIGFLLDAYRPQNIDDLLELEKTGKFDMDALKRYIKLCESEGVSFDLFDVDRPFLQSVYDSTLDGKEPSSVARLVYHMPSGVNKTIFSPNHTLEKDAVLSVPNAFKALLVNLCFLGTGGAGYFSNFNGAKCTYYLVEGDNLFQTLIRNIPLGEYVDIPYDDPPILWRYREKIDRSDLTSVSFMFGFLCQNRRICLRPSTENGKTVVRNIWFSSGHKYSNKDAWTDPHMAYYRDRKDVRRPVEPKHGRKGWQDVATILYQDGIYIPPQNIQVFREAIEERKIEDPVLRLHVFSFITGTHCTNHEDMVESELRLPTHLLKHPNKLPMVIDCVRVAEELGGRLRFALRTACNMRTTKDSESVGYQRVIDQMTAEFMYQAEGLFYELVDTRLAGEELDMIAIMDEWEKDIQRIASKAYDRFFENLGMNGRAMLQASGCKGILFAKKKEKKEA